MTKKRVSINGITRWKEINPAPQQVAPVVEEAKTVPLRQAIGEVLRDVRQRQGRTLREVSHVVPWVISAKLSVGRRKLLRSFWHGFARRLISRCTRCSVKLPTVWQF